MKKLFLTALTIAALAFTGCTQVTQTEVSEVTETSEPIITVDTEITETHFLPENEDWVKFENENISFYYPEGFTVQEQGENIYLTNSDSSAPLGMSEGEIWMNFIPSSKEEAESNDIADGTENIANIDYKLNGDGEWYKVELLMGGNGEVTEEAEDIFGKVKSRFFVL